MIKLKQYGSSIYQQIRVQMKVSFNTSFSSKIKAKYSLVYTMNSESLDLRKSKGIPNISVLYCELLHTVQTSNIPLKELHSVNC